MEYWWVILISAFVAIALHILANVKGWRVVIALNFAFHIGSILLFLLLEMELQEVFLFLLGSVTANMLIQWYLQRKDDVK